MGRPLGCLAVACASLLAAPAAFAQPAASCPERTVNQEIDRAIEERRRGREDAGFRRLQGLFERCPSPRTLAQLALAEHGLGRLREAYVHLRDALAREDDPWIATRRGPLRSVLAEITLRVPRLAPTCTVPGAELRVDGVLVGTLPLVTPWVLPQATVVLEVSAAGFRTDRQTVTVPDGAVWRESIVLAPEAAVAVVPVAPPVVVAPPAAASSARRAVGWGAVGLGAVFGAVSIWQAVAWSGQADDSRRATVTQGNSLGAWARFQRDANPGGRLSSSTVCDLAAASPTADGQGAASLCQENTQHAALAIGFGVAAGALAVTGVVLLVTGGSAEATPAVQVGAWLGDGVRGARIEGHF
jgi:hypothetical protein